MQPDPVSGRRLRFEIDMHARESIPGAIARGVREHVLVHTAPVLAAARVEMKHIGYSQIATPDELRRLAHVSRVEPRRFLERAGERLAEASGGKSMETRFGRLVMPRAFLELEKRRVGPSSLRNGGFHRLSWMNLLLPYCPESLERLIDRCAECGSGLGWRYAVGIGHCDMCDAEIPASTAPPLPAELAPDYRLFADLSSPDASRVDAATRSISGSLHAVTPAQLVRLALLLGGVVHDEPAAFSRHKVTELPPATLGLLATSGTALLRSWPEGLRTWVSEQSKELRAKPAALERLRARLRRAANRQMEDCVIADLMTEAFPDLRRHAAHSFSQDEPYYLYKGVQNLLGLSSPRMDALKKWSGLKFVQLSTAVGKQQGHFDVEQIDALVPAFRDTLDLNMCTGRFGLPLYAIGQLCGADVLEWENAEALLATGPRDKVRGASVRRLTADLIRLQRTGDVPTDAVSLSAGSRRIGGRLKPWGSIFRALTESRLPFWLRGDEPFITTIMVRFGDLARFEAVVDTPPPAGMATSPLIHQKDAAEVLNVPTPGLALLTGDYELPFERRGMGLATRRDRVLEVAAKIAWAGEIYQHLGVHPTKVAKTLDELGTRRIQSGWCRHHLVDRGILPREPGR